PEATTASFAVDPTGDLMIAPNSFKTVTVTYFSTTLPTSAEETAKYLATIQDNQSPHAHEARIATYQGTTVLPNLAGTWTNESDGQPWVFTKTGPNTYQGIYHGTGGHSHLKGTLKG